MTRPGYFNYYVFVVVVFGCFVVVVVVFSTSLFLAGNLGHLTGVRTAAIRAALPIAIRITVCSNNGMPVFRIFSFYLFTYSHSAQLLVHARAHGGCTDITIPSENLHWKLILEEKSLAAP